MTDRFWKQMLTNSAGYFLCVLASMYVTEPMAPAIAKLVYRSASLFTHLEPSGMMDFYTSNWLLFNLISDIACGASIYSVWRHIVVTLVWIPSVVVLCQKISTRPNSVMYSTSGSGLGYFLSTGCSEMSLRSVYISQRCADQFHYSVPVYAALGFSAGAFLSMVYSKYREVDLLTPIPPLESPSDAKQPIEDHNCSPQNHRDAQDHNG